MYSNPTQWYIGDGIIQQTARFDWWRFRCWRGSLHIFIYMYLYIVLYFFCFIWRTLWCVFGRLSHAFFFYFFSVPAHQIILASDQTMRLCSQNITPHFFFAFVFFLLLFGTHIFIYAFAFRFHLNAIGQSVAYKQMAIRGRNSRETAKKRSKKKTTNKLIPIEMNCLLRMGAFIYLISVRVSFLFLISTSAQIQRLKAALVAFIIQMQNIYARKTFSHTIDSIVSYFHSSTETTNNNEVSNDTRIWN